MKSILKVYFSHRTIQILWFFFLTFLAIIIETDILSIHFWWLFLPIIIAPFYEWYAHKYLLHAQLSKKPGWFRNFQIRLHHAHHKYPQNIELLFAPWPAIILHLVQTYVLFALLSWNFSVALVPFTFGILYYLFYEWMHLAHHTTAYQPKTKVGQRLKRAHMRHHFHNENYCWGITSYLGDKFLGTFKDKSQVSKSLTVKNIAGYVD